MAVHLQDTVSNIPPAWIAAGVLLRAQSDRFAQQSEIDATDPTTVSSGNTSRKVYAWKNRDGGETLTRRKLTEKDTHTPSGFMNAFVL